MFRRLIALDGVSLNRDEIGFVLYFLVTQHSLDFHRAERTSVRYRELERIFSGIADRRAALGIFDHPRTSAIADEEVAIELEMDWIAVDTMADWFCELGLHDLGDELRRDPCAFDQRLVAGERGLTGRVRGEPLWARWGRLPECRWRRTFTPRSVTGRGSAPTD